MGSKEKNKKVYPSINFWMKWGILYKGKVLLDNFYMNKREAKKFIEHKDDVLIEVIIMPYIRKNHALS